MGLFDKILKNNQPTQNLNLKSTDDDGAILIYSHLVGNSTPVSHMKDAVFAENILGLGHAIEPTEGIIYSPVSGTISTFYDTKHAICITSDEGIEILIHVGEDTVKLNGKCFTALAKENDKVFAGQPLLKFDIKGIQKAGYTVTTPLIILEPDNYKNIEFQSGEFSKPTVFAKIYK